MRTSERDNKKKRILRIVLLLFTGVVVITGISIFLLIRSYLSKINIDDSKATDMKALETDASVETKEDRRNWDPLIDEYMKNYEQQEAEDIIVYDHSEEEASVSDVNQGLESEAPTVEDEQLIIDQSEYDKQSSEEIVTTLNSLVEDNIKKEKEPVEDVDILNILFVVSDTATDKGDLYSIILLSINHKKEIISTITYSKLIYLQIPEKQKNGCLYEAYLHGGAKLLMKTLQNNFQVKISRYIETDKSSFQRLLEIMNGTSLDMEHVNRVLDEFLPCVTTNLKENEILTFVLMMPAYMKYDKVDYIIPLEESYEIFTLKGNEVYGINFKSNIDFMMSHLY